MHPEPSIPGFLVTSILAGILGAGGMELTMWLICRTGWAKGNMIIAVGSMLTRARANAWRAGVILHAASAIVFAMLYYLAMIQLGLNAWPTSIEVGVLFGIIHGMIVSLALVWMVAEQHPLPEFQEAGLAIGVSHFAGHIAYGGLVGLVIAIVSVH